MRMITVDDTDYRICLMTFLLLSIFCLYKQGQWCVLESSIDL